MEIYEEDREFMRKQFDLNDEEIKEAEKLFYRSPFSICKSAEIVLGRRQTGFKPKTA